MARSLLVEVTTDLNTDSGSVLWSFIKGEQLEYPVALNFIANALTGYTYECVVVEGLNVALQTTPPITNKPGGIQTTLTVRVPVLQGTWNSANAYGQDDVVLYAGSYYRRVFGGTSVDVGLPSVSPYWVLTTLSTVFVQFPATLGSTWAIQPSVGCPSYGFFELRVTENFGVGFRRTWKPVRGMVELLFSPTAEVADA